MTATRMARAAGGIATITLAAGLWLAAAWLLWRTRVPDDLRLPRLDPRDYFSAALLRRTARHDGFLRIDFLLALLAQLGGIALVAARAERIEARLRGGALLRGLELALVAGAAGWLARFPFGLAAQWWERRYGLSRESYGAWLWHRLPAPGTIAGLLLVLAILILLARRLGRRWWLAGGPVLAAFAIVAALVEPVFGGGLQPLRDRALAADVRSFAASEGLGDADVGVVKVHRQTRIANAEAVGIGPTARVELWDTLLDGRFTRAEVRVVVAHELGHLARRHIWKGLGWFALFSLPLAYVLAAASERSGGLARPAAVPAVLAAAAALQILSLPVAGTLSRRYEAEADWVALQTTRDPAGARGLFERFAVVNLDQPRPPTWAYVLLSDHPALIQRIAMAEAWKRRYSP